MSFYFYTFLFLFLFSYTITYSLVEKLVTKKMYSKKLPRYFPITPKNTIITFDLHDVIVHYNYSEIAKTFFKSKGKLGLIIAMLNPLIWWNIIKLTWQDSVAEQYIVGLGEKYPSLKPYVPLGIRIANCQKPDPEMLAFIKELKNKGYTLHLFSNIGAEIFEQFGVKFPEIIKYFDMVSIPSKQNGYLKKPYGKAFAHYLEKLKGDERQVLFVDDKQKNIQKAYSYGIIGIHFSSLSKLKQALGKMGLES